MARKSVKRIMVEVPNKPKIVRVKKARYRVWLFDLRGIRNHPPITDDDFDVLRGKKFRNYSGEKPIFSSPEALEKDVEMYFESCFTPLIDKKKGEVVRDHDGQIIRVQTKPFTVSGLARYIGVPTSSFHRLTVGLADDWSETDEDKLYCAILQQAKQTIEEYSETRLYDKDGFNGAKFVLDHHFRMITRREEAEIRERERLVEIREQELEMKKQALQLGEEDDNNLKITIVRKEPD